jgi:hypothetical protein
MGQRASVAFGGKRILAACCALVAVGASGYVVGRGIQNHPTDEATIALADWTGTPRSLHGRTRAQIRRMFGEPSTCEPIGEEPLGDPCLSVRDWFYPLHPGGRGGRVLLLQFDDRGTATPSPNARCIAASWESTK